MLFFKFFFCELPFRIVIFVITRDEKEEIINEKGIKLKDLENNEKKLWKIVAQEKLISVPNRRIYKLLLKDY